jgi:hypothetical protein
MGSTTPFQTLRVLVIGAGEFPRPAYTLFSQKLFCCGQRYQSFIAGSAGLLMGQIFKKVRFHALHIVVEHD